MEEFLRALGPWPLLQGIAFGLVIAAIGAWAVRRGLQDSRKNEPDIEDIKARWELHKAIGHIQQNSFEIVKLLERANELAEQQLAVLNRIFDDRWNRSQ